MDFQFERAWRRVGVALDRLGFTIVDRKSQEGFYTIRTVEPGVVERKKEKDGFFSKMFSKQDNSPIEITNSRIDWRIKLCSSVSKSLML